MTCQVAHCRRPARTELEVAPGLVLDVCRPCATDETVRAFSRGGNIGVFYYLDRRVVLACGGNAPVPRQVGYAEGVPRWSEPAVPWSAYLLPCIDCGKDFAFDVAGRDGRCSLKCEACAGDERPLVQPPLSEDQAADEAHELAAAVIEEENMSPKDEVADFSRYEPPWAPNRPLWEHLEGPTLRQAAEDAYEERAAIRQYDGEEPRLVAEKEAYQEVVDKAVDARLVTHEQLGLFG